MPLDCSSHGLRLGFRAWLLVLLLGVAWAAPARAAGGDVPVTDEEVGKVIARLQKFLYEQQDQNNGSWDDSEMANKQGVGPGAGTALVLTALLYSGESSQRPEIDKALKYLRNPDLQLKTTYQVSTLAHVWAHLPQEKYGGKLQICANWLETAARPDKTWTYSPYKELALDKLAAFDHSNTQYGILGMWECSKRGLRFTSGNFWDEVIKHWTAVQNADGGWYYDEATKDKSTGSMTAAGLTALFVAQQEARRALDRPDPKLRDALRKGMLWMDEQFAPTSNPGSGSWTFYYLYGVERVALASGVKNFGKFDWFRSGADTIINTVGDNGDGGGPVNSCFKLMFLARGRVPVWITKLQIPGLECNNRPNDIYFLNEFLSSYREGEVNWQFLPLDKTTAEELRSTPILYLASDQEIKLTPAQEALLKRYLDLGGLLLANPDRDSEAFQGSIKRLAEKLYPHLKGDYLPATHLIFNVQHVMEPGELNKVWGLSNGARDLILMPTPEWGRRLQAEEVMKRGSTWRMAANLFVLATDRGVLENRLVDRFETRDPKQTETGAMVVGRARYNGNWLPEPLAWDPLATRVFNRAGITLTVTGDGSPKAKDAEPVLDLDKIDACDCKLVHLAGTDQITLTDAQKTALKAYVKRGGTVLVESVGGRGQFSLGIERQLEGLIDGSLSQSIQVFNPEEPILTGKGLAGGYDAQEAKYRRYTAWNFPDLRNQPALSAYYIYNRPAIIFSHYDLSLGVLDVRHWGITGYAPETAREMMTNIVLRAQQQKLVPPGQVAPPPAPPAEPTTAPAGPATQPSVAGAATQPEAAAPAQEPEAPPAP